MNAVNTIVDDIILHHQKFGTLIYSVANVSCHSESGDILPLVKIPQSFLLFSLCEQASLSTSHCIWS